MECCIVHGRSGRVALPRVVVSVRAARLDAVGADARSALRRALFLKSVVAIVIDLIVVQL